MNIVFLEIDDIFIFVSVELRRRNVIRNACKVLGSVSDSDFDIRFNPDVCSPGIQHTPALTHTQKSSIYVHERFVLSGFAAGVRFPSGCTEEVQRQRQLMWDAAAFLLSDQIPAVVSHVWGSNIQVNPLQNLYYIYNYIVNVCVC